MIPNELTRALINNKISLEQAISYLYSTCPEENRRNIYYYNIIDHLIDTNNSRDSMRISFQRQGNYGCIYDKKLGGYRSDLTSLHDIYKHRTLESKFDLFYWVGNEVSIYFNPILISFYNSQSDLRFLGWGSSTFGQQLIKDSNCSEFEEDSYCVILTRHRSKFAHFVRDRLSKVVWAHYYSDEGPYKNYIFDYQLNKKELQCLKDFGIDANYIYADEHKCMKLKGRVKVMQVMSGMSTLVYLKKYLHEVHHKDKVNRRRLFLKRGLNGRRRDISNIEEVEKTIKGYGYETIELENMEILDQLLYCINSENVCGVHGAQIINALTSKSIIEINSLRYSLSEWSRTMQDIDRLEIRYTSFTMRGRILAQ